ncbi:MAG: type IX secretion system membrane protein PorP/SprF [Cytophagales bacterium]|nr:type IX secretion system membrane protein PorP/SprF [Cytophagales bacterium]
MRHFLFSTFLWIRRHPFCLFPLLFAFTVQGQNRLLVSQYMYNGLILNPAYAGSQQVFSLTGLYRQQWFNVQGAPAYQVITCHTPMMSNKIGVGLLLSRESVGVHHNFGSFASYSYKIKLSHGYVSMGLSGGVSINGSNYSNLNLFHSEDSHLLGYSQRTVPNFGVGTYYYNANVYAGISVPYILNSYQVNLLNPEQDTSIIKQVNEPRAFYVTGGFVIGDSGQVFKAYPSTLIRILHGASLGVDLNLHAIFYDVVMSGISYRVGSTASLLFQIILNDNVRVMYSYDLIANRLATGSRGSHEIALSYRIKIKTLSRDPLCASYF